MSSINPSSSKIGKNNQTVQEPQSAHATPVVEKYIKKRNIKAEKQIKHEINGSSANE